MAPEERLALYLKYKGMIHPLAERFDPFHTQIYWDLVQAAESYLLEQVTRWGTTNEDAGRYDKKRGAKESTWVYRLLYWTMLDHSRKACRVRSREESLTREELLIPQKPNWLTALLMDLGDEAKVLVQLVINGPAELVENFHPRRAGIARTALREYLRRKLGWSDTQVELAWAEVQDCLS